MNQLLPVFGPRVLFSKPIQGGLKDGMTITVCGRVLPNADRFHVNLQRNSDVVLHINPRYTWFWIPYGYVVHSSCQNGTWDWEENKSETPFPRGQTFTLQIVVTQDSYKKIPYKSIIHGGLQPDKVIIIIQGVISPQANRMGFSLRHKTGIAFECVACFNENEVVCNSCENGKWGQKERFTDMPFRRGQLFQVTICCSPDNYKVFVNGGLSHTYNHRYTKLQEIDVLEISGNVQLSFVQP
ncbi:galectin-9-like isoform X1 [Labeo rohita]|uniref:Galectin n=1 Tax=Labeo rohita TaxID=84645 RepID=A0A498M2W1_LABRO|nr:galectin-9-like isoform X1 [Labeo rohita]RXN37905.1 galectin-9-like isoform X1 [Labeo rohita]